MHLFYMQVFVKSSTSYILDTLLDLKVTALKRVIKIPAHLSRIMIVVSLIILVI